MLVELHSFPGFDNDILTPLPSPLKTIDIIQSVTSAQLDLETKVIVTFIEILRSLFLFYGLSLM